MKSANILYVVFFIPFTLNAQDNMFPNPGFEEYTNCYSEQIKDSNRIVKSWSHPIAEEAQPTNPCDKAWEPYLQAIEARTGSAVQYFAIWYNDPRYSVLDTRDYLITHLKKPLIENNSYFFKMHVRCVFNKNLENFCLANGQAVAFTKLPPKQPDDDAPLKLIPVIQNESLADSFWTEVSGCFKAKGGEEYAVLGNFKSKKNTLTKRLANPRVNTIDPSINPDLINNVVLAAYIVDDVELLPLNIDLPKDTSICEGETLILNVKNNLQATYRWQDGTTTPQYSVAKTGIYSVLIDYYGINCKVEQSIKVNVLPKSKPILTLDTLVCSYRTVLLKTGTGRKDDSIRWQDNSTRDTFRVSRNGIYEAQITNSCGTYRASYKVNFVNCTIDVYVPNAFSPNGDNLNDTFAPFVHAAFPITDYEFAVYNRWGSRLFFTKDLNAVWDGTFQNKLVDDGVYIWYCITKGTIGTKKILKEESGDVTLMR